MNARSNAHATTPSILVAMAMALAILVGSARAGEPSSFDALLGAIDSRMAIIDGAAKPTKTMKKEAKGLAAASAKLGQYTGQDDPADLKRLSAAAGAIVKSKTFDIGVLGTVGAIRNAIDRAAEQAQQDTKSNLFLLGLAKHQTKIGKALAAADAAREAALLAWLDHHGKGAKKLVAVVARYRKSAAMAKKVLVKEAKLSPNDAQVLDAIVLTPDVQIGHPIVVVVETSLEQPAKELTIVLRAVLKSDVDTYEGAPDDDTAIMTQCALGETTLFDVAAGSRLDTLEFVVPTTCEDPFTGKFHPLPADDYYVVVEVDPHDRLIETHGDSPESNNIFLDTTAPVHFGSEHQSTPNIVLESAAIHPAVIFNKKETAAGATSETVTTFGVNARVSVTGEEGVSGIPITVALEQETLDVITQQPTGLFKTTHGVIWDDKREEYVDELLLPTIPPGEATVVHLDVKFPFQTVPNADIIPVSELAGITVTVNPDNNPMEYEPDGPDNSVRVDEATWLVMDLPECSFSQTFEKSMGNDDFGVSIGFGSSIDVTGDPKDFPTGPPAMAGAVATAQAGIDIKLMGFDLDLVTYDVLLERDPIEDYSYFGADLKFLDFTIYAVGPVNSPMLEQIPVLPKGLKVIDGGFRFTKAFTKAKSVKKIGQFYPGGVPVFVEGKVEGGIGFEMALTATDALTISAGPFVELKAAVAFGLGVCPSATPLPGPLCIGAGGVLTLVRDTFITTAGAGMTVVNGPGLDGKPAQAIDTALCFSVVNRVNMLDGNLFVFAEIAWWDTCPGPFGSSWPCNFGAKRFTLPILPWKGFAFCQPLVNGEASICCITVSGQPICDPGIPTSTACIPPDCQALEEEWNQ